MKEVYVVMHANYSDWQIHGFFTNKEDADKWATLHGDYKIVQTALCLDDTVDYRNIHLKYEHEIVFDHKVSGWEMRDEPNRYTTYIGDYLRSNRIRSEYFTTNRWVGIKVNIEESNRKKAEKIAQDLLYQYLDTCNGVPDDESTKTMNLILSEEECNREELLKQETLRKKELAELERLKKKYEQ